MNLPSTITIPRFTLGIDIETKDVIPPAYLLSIGGVLFDNYTLKPVEIFNVTFDPNDEGQAKRTASNFTLEWWHRRGDPDDSSVPTQTAFDLTWNGTTKFNDGMNAFDKFMRGMPRKDKGDVIIPMRGPDFDYPILKHAARQAYLRTPLYASPLDSHRTVERVCVGLGIPEISEAELSVFWKGPKVPHVAVFDAAYEGYETARMYHVIHCIKVLGYKETMKRIERWQDVDNLAEINLIPEEK